MMDRALPSRPGGAARRGLLALLLALVFVGNVPAQSILPFPTRMSPQDDTAADATVRLNQDDQPARKESSAGARLPDANNDAHEEVKRQEVGPRPASKPVQCNPFAPRITYNPCVPEPEPPIHWEIGEHFLEALEAPSAPLAHCLADLMGVEHYEPHTPLHSHPIPIQGIPDRPELLLETNERFLAPGFLEQGIVLPTGAVWRPSIWLFGTFRTGFNYFDNRAGTNVTEWVNRLNLFGQLNLSGTERLLVGVRPLDEELTATRRFTGVDLRNGRRLDGWNMELQTLFFEGDFGEIFPRLDPYDRLALDYGFSVGRQPMLFQQGLLINEDRIDAVTVTRNTLDGCGVLNLRATGVYAWNEINRNNNVHDPDAQMVGLFTEADVRQSTINADVAYLNSESGMGSVLALGLSAIQRLHGFHNTYNTSFHVLASFPTDDESPAARQGELLFSQISWTPHHSNDLVYLNSFWAIDQFTSPARGPLAGGPLGQTGILFSAPGLGSFGAPLSNQAGDAVGSSLGYQLFFDESRQQIIFELGGRQDTNRINQAAIAGGFRYQRAIGQHWIFLVDTFLTKRESCGLAPGTRVEFLAKF